MADYQTLSLIRINIPKSALGILECTNSEMVGSKTNQSVLFAGWGLLFRCVIAFWLYLALMKLTTISIACIWTGAISSSSLVALTTGFGPWVTGVVSQFTIRLGALILHTGSLLLYLTSAKLFSIKAARLTGDTIIPIFKLVLHLTLPDSPLIFFWSASLCWVNFPPSAPQLPPTLPP